MIYHYGNHQQVCQRGNSSSMRIFLLFIGWASLLASLVDFILGSFAAYLVTATDTLTMAISLDLFLRDFVPFIYWVKQVAYYVMPTSVVIWLFNLPALLYFPVRVLLSLVIGWYAFKLVNAMDAKVLR